MLRRLIEARMGKRGKREFVQVLRLLEVFREDVLAGVREAIACGAIGGRCVVLFWQRQRSSGFPPAILSRAHTWENTNLSI
jgi:hypothetical protein